MKIKLTRFDLRDNHIRGYVKVEETEYEAISIPTTKGLYGMNMIAMTDETLKGLIEMLNNSLGDNK